MKQRERQSGRQSGDQIEKKRGYTVRDSVADKPTNKAETQWMGDKLGDTVGDKLVGKVGEKAEDKVGDKVGGTRRYKDKVGGGERQSGRQSSKVPGGRHIRHTVGDKLGNKQEERWETIPRWDTHWETSWETQWGDAATHTEKNDAQRAKPGDKAANKVARIGRRKTQRNRQ